MLRSNPLQKTAIRSPQGFLFSRLNKPISQIHSSHKRCSIPLISWCPSSVLTSTGPCPSCTGDPIAGCSYLPNRLTSIFFPEEKFVFAGVHEIFSTQFSSLLMSLHTAALLFIVPISPLNFFSSINSWRMYSIHSIASFRS